MKEGDVSYMPIPELRKRKRGKGGRFVSPANDYRQAPDADGGKPPLSETPRDPTIPPDAFERTDLAFGRTRVWQGTDGTLYVRTLEGDA